MIFRKLQENIFIKNIRYYSDFAKIVEVGPRDGIQSEKKILPSSVKIELINRLSETGLKTIETTSFVSPKWIPQMSDNSEVFQGIKKNPNVCYPVLVPNLKGLELAIASGAKEIATFGSASETFSMKNINCSIAESMKNFHAVITEALKHNMKIRGYVSCIAGCPYEGAIKPIIVAKLTEVMLDSGCYEVSLGDTIGVGTPKTIKSVLNEVKNISKNQDLSKIAMHCHDTYGQAIVNIFSSMDFGIRVFDSSVAGLGGCPYADGAAGNVSTEDLIYHLHGEGIATDVDLEKIVLIGEWISGVLEKENRSKVGNAILSKIKKNRK